MFKKILIRLVAYLFLISNVYAAGSDGDSSSGSSSIKSNYDKAVSHIKIAKKHEKKGKLEKAKERYLIAQKLLIKSQAGPGQGIPSPGRGTWAGPTP